MLQKDLVDYLENLRDCLDDVWGNVAYIEKDEQRKQVLEDLTESSFMIDALISKIKSEGVREY